MNWKTFNYILTLKNPKPIMRAVKHQHKHQVAQRGCAVFILGDIQNLTGHCPGQPAVAGLTLSRGLHWTIYKGLFYPQPFCD